MSLRPENRPIYENMKAMLDKKGKCILITHPGRGKSFITEEYMAEACPKDVICICPTNAICLQWENDHNTIPMRIVTYAAFSEYDKTAIGKPDLVIIDEAHHMGAPVWGKNICYVIQELVPKGTKVIALTADPIRWNDNLRNVANEWFKDAQVWGPTMTDSMEEGFINPFTYVISLYATETEIRKRTKKAATLPEPKRKAINSMIGKMQYLPENVRKTSRALQDYAPEGNKKGIVFCSRISDIPKAQDTLLQAYPDIPHFTINSNKTGKTNKNQITAFSNASEGFLFCVGMATEGVHCKVNMVIMFRKTGSPNLYVQMVGRIIDPDVTDAYLHDIVCNSTSIQNVIKKADIDEAAIMSLNTALTMKRQNGQQAQAATKKQIIIKNLAKPALDELMAIDDAMERSRGLSDEEKLAIKDLYPNTNINQIAKRLHRSRATIEKYLRQQGLISYGPVSGTEQGPPQWTQVRTDALNMLLDEGETPETIAKIMGTTEQDVLDKIKELETQI